MTTWKTTTALAAVLMLQAGTALAESASSELPQEGTVSRLGTVERIVDGNTFILEDQQTGKTVDVHTARNVNLKAGTYVRVEGTADSDFMGMGHEITNASVTKVNGGIGGPLEPLTDEQTNTYDKGMELDNNASRDAGSTY